VIEIQPVPMMDPPEVAAMRALIEERRPHRVLEFGSGGSTLYWPAEFPDLQWDAVEHNPSYANAIRARLPKNASLRLIDFPDYYRVSGKYDLVIVDGRERLHCLDAARWLVKDGGAVLLHDAGRERYAPARDYYERLTVLSPPKAGQDPRGLWLLEGPKPLGKPAEHGVMYLCWGEPATREAEASMASLWAVAPGMPVLVVGDEAAAEYFARRENVSAHVLDVDPFSGEHLFGFKAGRVKPLLAAISPFERTLYVDAETEFMRSPEEGFALLDCWDFVIAEAETRSLAMTSRDNQAEAGQTAAELGSTQILYHNSGMFFWRSGEASAELFDLWSEEWERYAGWDEQVALLRALLRSQVLYLNLPYTWNCRGPNSAYFVYHRFASKAARKYTNFARAVRANETRGQVQDPPRRLVSFELEPGRIVKCYDGDQDRVLEAYLRQVKREPG
jgi:hypothetical protein